MPPGWVPVRSTSAPARESIIATAANNANAAAVATWYGLKPLLDPVELLRDVLVELLVVGDQLVEVRAGAEVGLQLVVGHELLPIVGVVDLLEDVDPERLLALREAGRRHDRADDEVVADREPLRRAGRHALECRGRRARGLERAERPHLAGRAGEESLALARVVHRGHDAALMAGDGRGDRRAGGRRDELERLDPRGGLDAVEPGVLLLPRAGARHDERIGLRGGDEVLRGLPWTVVIHPEVERVEREVGDRREVRRLVRELLDDERGEEGVERDRDDAPVTLVVVHVLERHRARAALAVHRRDRLRRELQGLDDRLHLAGVDVGATARSGADDEFDGLRRWDHRAGAWRTAGRRRDRGHRRTCDRSGAIHRKYGGPMPREVRWHYCDRRHG